jgi:cytidylate kinase
MVAELTVQAMRERRSWLKTARRGVSLVATMTTSRGSPFVVAIDGPAGAGKSTVARALAERLGYTLLDTGALYRSVALMAKRRQIPWDDGPRLGQLASGLSVAFVKDGEQTRVVADGCDVTAEIRSAEISEGASRVSALPEVRQGLLGIQRRVAGGADIVAEGRDVGTVVFPSAQAKFFLVANPETRARRRALELHAAGRPADFEKVLAEMRARDARDSDRAHAPLRRATDAIEIDSSDATPEEVVERMMAVVLSRGG